jgi:23S rRNA (cytidine1920-2'-O)/16S rRNA (cytidine1409-2'-O)-methyltransferase
MRLDKYLLEHNLVQSRNKANELIKQNQVKVNDKIITKPSFDVNENDTVDVLQEKVYVSRAAYKLKSFLEQSSLNISAQTVLDIGSSTGGFVQILLEYGAKEVWAVDVGSGQLDKTLKQNSKVHSYENTDIRDFKSDKKFDIVTCDVSFIGVEHILSSIEHFAKRDIILLFKPQFEVGKGVKRDKKGVVLDQKAIDLALENFEEKAKCYNWKLISKQNSKTKGKEGNVEKFYHFTRQ